MFSPGPRSRSEPATPAETYFDFLNRVNTRYWSDVRVELDRWFRSMPESAQHQMRQRLRSDDAGFWSAFWELFLFRLFVALDFDVEVEPEIEGGLTPDFRINGVDGSLLVEATVVMEPREYAASERRLAPILEYLKSVKSAGYWLGLGRIREGDDQPSARMIADSIQEWLDGLPKMEPGESPITERFQTTVGNRGWVFEINAIPKSNPSESAGVHLGPVRGRMVDDHLAMTENLRFKARKYRDKGTRLALAILNNRWTASIDAERVSVYGAAWEYPEMMRTAQIDPSWRSVPEGLWVSRSGLQYSQVVGVLAGFHIGPHNFVKRELRVWHPPGFGHPLRELPLGHGYSDSDGVVQIVSPKKSIRDLLGLQEDWPTGEPFPDQPPIHSEG